MVFYTDNSLEYEETLVFALFTEGDFKLGHGLI